MVRTDKIELVERISQKLKQSQSIIVTDYKGMTVFELERLRTLLREQGVEVKVIKNRLVRRALSEAGQDNLDEYLHGNSAIVFGIKDPVAPAKILMDFVKKNQKLVIKGGLLEGRRLNPAGVAALSTMPNRKQLLSILAGDFKQPAAKMATVFQAGLLKVAYAMKALAAKQEEAADGSAA